MSRGREPHRNGRHISELPRPQAAGLALAHRAYGLVKLDRTRWDKRSWRHYLTVNLRYYRNLRTGREWNDGL